jgi:hypothetical protein
MRLKARKHREMTGLDGSNPAFSYGESSKTAALVAAGWSNDQLASHTAFAFRRFLLRRETLAGPKRPVYGSRARAEVGSRCVKFMLKHTKSDPISPADLELIMSARSASESLSPCLLVKKLPEGPAWARKVMFLPGFNTCFELAWIPGHTDDLAWESPPVTRFAIRVGSDPV